MQGAPLAAGLVAFGAGVIVAALIPASEKEAVAAGHVVDAAKEHGQPVVDQAKSVAQDVADSVKTTAAEAAQEVKDTASDSAGKVKSEGQSGVDVSARRRSPDPGPPRSTTGPSLPGGPVRCAGPRQSARRDRVRVRVSQTVPGRLASTTPRAITPAPSTRCSQSSARSSGTKLACECLSTTSP